MIAWFKSGVLLLTAFLLGYPLLTLAQHGYDIRLWPDVVLMIGPHAVVQVES